MLSPVLWSGEVAESILCFRREDSDRKRAKWELVQELEVSCEKLNVVLRPELTKIGGWLVEVGKPESKRSKIGLVQRSSGSFNQFPLLSFLGSQ